MNLSYLAQLQNAAFNHLASFHFAPMKRNLIAERYRNWDINYLVQATHDQ